MGGIMKSAPNALIYTVGVVFVAILAAFVIVSLNGASTEELWVFLNRLANLAGMIFGAGGMIAAGAAANSAKKAETATNGDMDVKIERAVRRAISMPDPENLPDGK